jgi:hypothetical protein
MKTRVEAKYRTDYLKEHIPYRLNSLRAYDIYILKRTAERCEDEEPENKCYWKSEFLEPALEVSILFGRSLLHFLGLTLKKDKLDYYVSNKDDDVQIWDIIPGKSPYPIEKINESDQQVLCNLIKVANKSVAHLTIKTSTDEEFKSLKNARHKIYELVLEYVDGLRTDSLWYK